MKLSKEFNKNAEVKRTAVTETETETISHSKVLSQYFCAVAMRAKQAKKKTEVHVVRQAPVVQANFRRAMRPRV